MILVKFHIPQLIQQNGITSRFTEIICFATLYDAEFDDRQIWVTQNEMTLVHECSIKSIEHVKPTEL